MRSTLYLQSITLLVTVFLLLCSEAQENQAAKRSLYARHDPAEDPAKDPDAILPVDAPTTGAKKSPPPKPENQNDSPPDTPAATGKGRKLKDSWLQNAINAVVPPKSAPMIPEGSRDCRLLLAAPGSKHDSQVEFIFSDGSPTISTRLFIYVVDKRKDPHTAYVAYRDGNPAGWNNEYFKAFIQIQGKKVPLKFETPTKILAMAKELGYITEAEAKKVETLQFQQDPTTPRFGPKPKQSTAGQNARRSLNQQEDLWRRGLDHRRDIQKRNFDRERDIQKRTHRRRMIRKRALKERALRRR